MDLSQLSDDDLKRLANNDYTKLSDDAKILFKAAPEPQQTQPQVQAQGQPNQPLPQQGPDAPSMLSQAGDFAMKNIVTPAVGAVQTAAQYGMSNPLTTTALGLGAANYGAIKNLAQQGINTFQTNNLAKLGEQIRLGERFGQDMSGMKQIFQQQSQQQAQKMAAQQAAQNQPGIIQQGMDYASKIRQLAYEKALQGARGVGTAIEAAAPTAEAIASRMAPYVKAGGALGAMTYSAPLGPQVPMQGPYKGMEINPMSGRPWTPQELQQINR